MNFKEWFAKKQGEHENTIFLSDLNLFYEDFEECWNEAVKYENRNYRQDI